MAIENELEAWQKAGGFSQRDNALRCGASPAPPRAASATCSGLLLWLPSSPAYVPVNAHQQYAPPPHAH